MILGHQLTLFTEDHRASRSVWREGSEDKVTSDIYGEMFSSLSPTLCRVFASLRTYLASCRLPQMTFVRNWSASATASGYAVLKLRLSERSTGGCASFLWATPNAADCQGSHGGGQGKSLRTDVRIFPTPMAAEAKRGANHRYARGNLGLSAVVHMFPTPTANDSKNNAAPSQMTENGRHSDALNVVVGGGLNPFWVEWLMGFPVGWTDIGTESRISQESPEVSKTA